MKNDSTTPRRSTPARRPADLRPLPPKWVLLAAFWLVQGGVIYMLGVLWIFLTQSAGKAALFGNLPSLREYLAALAERDAVLIVGIYVLVLTALQGVLLLPVRKPGLAGRERGASLWGSIAVAGLAIAAVWIGAVLSVGTLFAIAWPDETPWIGFVVERVWMGGSESMFLLALVMSWAFATPLVAAFCRSGPRETALARLSTRILQGTAVEVVAIIPLDVMVRRKTDCYCNSGTFWALMLCGTVGVLLAGPAALLTVLTRRRRRWMGDRCEVCGYDMTGLRNADWCPECGCGWAAAPAGTAGGNAE